jgi:hypothetical protein
MRHVINTDGCPGRSKGNGAGFADPGIGTGHEGFLIFERALRIDGWRHDKFQAQQYFLEESKARDFEFSRRKSRGTELARFKPSLIVVTHGIGYREPNF